MVTTPDKDDPTDHHATDQSAVFMANIHAVNLMQQRVFCNRAQAIDDPAQQKRLLESSQRVTDIIREIIG